jgi:carbon storage regulator CsrA
MLVLTRKDQPGKDTVVIGDTVVKILEVRGNTVRLGITAGPHINVAREEVLITAALAGVCQSTTE